MKKQRKNKSKYIDKIIALKKKHGDIITWTQIGREIGTTPQNARGVYKVWLKTKV